MKEVKLKIVQEEVLAEIASAHEDTDGEPLKKKTRAVTASYNLHPDLCTISVEDEAILKDMLEDITVEILREEIQKEQAIIKWRPYDDYGDIMSIAEFVESVKIGEFMPYDGSGYWATDIQISDQSVWESEIPEWATHAAWYNR